MISSRGPEKCILPPPVQTIYATIQALKEYWAEGEEAKWARHTRVFEAIHEGLDALGFHDVIRREWQSGLVYVSVKYPDDPNWNFEKVHDYCYERDLPFTPAKSLLPIPSACVHWVRLTDRISKPFSKCSEKHWKSIKFRFRQNIRRHRIKMKRVYTCFCTDVIHEGHRNIIREAGKYGELTIGVL